MAERLEWIKLQPKTWVDWEPVRGGIAAHALVQDRYPKSECWIVEGSAHRSDYARKRLAPSWWRRLAAPPQHFGPPPEGGAQMLWSNMLLHMDAQPEELIARWHSALAVDGFVMFSCLGPDTLRELRGLYRALGWPPASHEFTDMHDWGDMLVHAGFAEPVMDMERLTLTWESPQAMLTELRGLGTNLHPGRFPGLRGRGWRRGLEAAMPQGLAAQGGKLGLTFEIIYGHALKPQPRARVSAESAISLQDMHGMLRGGKRAR
jgi:malonyl-CoA O-methyltransferase